jgi:hypothetical protein
MTAMAPATLDRPGAEPLRLVRSELLKIRTTSAWWWFAIGALTATAVAFAFNAYFAHMALTNPEQVGLNPEQARAYTNVVVQAANVYTSGQFFGLMFVMLLGILMVTNEFFHQTATTTFLTTPRRTTVIFSKLGTAVLVGFGFWLVTTAIDLAAGAIFLNSEGFGSQLGEWPVQRAILLNLLAYAIWTIFGIGIGTLITNQLGATITAVVLYVVGTQLAGVVFLVLSNVFHNEKILEWQVVVPSIASQVMVAGGDNIPGSPAWWVGALVLVTYAVATGFVGMLITRRRDIS